MSTTIWGGLQKRSYMGLQSFRNHRPHLSQVCLPVLWKECRERRFFEESTTTILWSLKLGDRPLRNEVSDEESAAL